MKRTLEKTLKKFAKNLNKGKSVFIISQDQEDGNFLGLMPEDVNLDTLLIHKKIDGTSTLQGFINNVSINDMSSSIYILLDLEDIDFPEVYFFENGNENENINNTLNENTEDFISIFCEFVPYSILIYVFNTPFSQIGKKNLSAKNGPLTNYFKHLFLNTLPDNQRKLIQDSLYAEKKLENKGETYDEK